MLHNDSDTEDGWFCISMIATTSIIVLLCSYLWEMYTNDFMLYLKYAAIVAAVGIPLTIYCFHRLHIAQKREGNRKLAELQETEALMYYENQTIVNHHNGSTITIEGTHSGVVKKLKAENKALKEMLKTLEEAFQARVEHHTIDARNFDAERKQWQDKFDTIHDHYKKLFRDHNLENIGKLAELAALKKKSATAKAEHVELVKLRKAERTRKGREKKLLGRVEKIRKQAFIEQLDASRTSLLAAWGFEKDNSDSENGDDVSNCIIALIEYLRHYEPTEELYAYLWACRRVGTLALDIHKGVVRRAFGSDWESLLLSGLVGLNIVDVKTLISIARNSNLLPLLYES